MNRTDLMIGAGVGAWVGWLIAKHLQNRGVEKVPITLKKVSAGCGVEDVPDVAIKALFGPMQWVITNPKEGGCGTVTVRIGNWKKDGEDSEPPVISAGPLERDVKPGKAKTITAAGFPAMEHGEYKYDVIIGTDVVLDPIVKLIP